MFPVSVATTNSIQLSKAAQTESLGLSSHRHNNVTYITVIFKWTQPMNHKSYTFTRL